MATIRGWKFPVEVDKSTGRIMTVDDNENVKQSINIILQTEKSERKMRPSFGTSLRDFMFENIDSPLMRDMTNEINRSIKLWEKHIAELNISIKDSPEKLSTVIADISYVTDILPIEEKIVKKFDMDDLNM